MRIYVVHPGVPFSTADCFTGLVTGLRANGVEVVEGRLDEALVFQTALYEAGQKLGVVQAGALNYSMFTSPYIVQHAIASEPDAVIVVSAHNFNIASARTLQKAGLKTAVLMTESPYFAAFERAMAQAYDVVFTHERRCANRAYFDHPHVHYLPHAFNPAVHRPGEIDPALACDVFFCGSLFEERARLFAGVDWSGITFLRRGYEPGKDGDQDIVSNSDVVRHYWSARINLNHHRTTTEFGSGQHIQHGSAASLNPRAYELAACGAFQLCDDGRAELYEIFGDSVPTYRAGDSADLEAKLRSWLARPSERAALADEARSRVESHSWVQRARQVLETIL